MPLTAIDYKSLELIFTGELGTSDDYRREYQETPFGLLVRKIAKLEVEAANAQFSEFINDQSLSHAQIVFVKKVIDYIVQNGYIENISELTKPPFDKPLSFIKLFDGSKQKQIVGLVTQIKENAIHIVG
jgi:type I restriction enzyme R subunit